MKNIDFDSYKLFPYHSNLWVMELDLTDVNLAPDNCEGSILTQYIIKNQNNKIYVHLFIHFVNL